MKRRTFLAGILAVGMAPAIVRAGSLMRVNPHILVPRRLTAEDFNQISTQVVIGEVDHFAVHETKFDREAWLAMQEPIVVDSGACRGDLTLEPGEAKAALDRIVERMRAEGFFHHPTLPRVEAQQFPDGETRFRLVAGELAENVRRSNELRARTDKYSGHQLVLDGVSLKNLPA